MHQVGIAVIADVEGGKLAGDFSREARIRPMPVDQAVGVVPETGQAMEFCAEQTGLDAVGVVGGKFGAEHPGGQIHAGPPFLGEVGEDGESRFHGGH